MVERKPQLSDQLRYEFLKLIEKNPDFSQRELASALGISLGKVNYCIRAIARKGLVKARNFKNSKSKLAYAYYLTPRGIEAKAQLAIEFLKVKLGEVETLRKEIAELQGREEQQDHELLEEDRLGQPS